MGEAKSSSTSKAINPVFKSGSDTSHDKYLALKVKAYSNNRRLIQWLLWAFLIAGIAYLAYIFLATRKQSYQELLNSGYKLTGNIGASRDGHVIAIAAQKDPDNYTIFVSNDSGQHFLRSGSWMPKGRFDQLYVAGDNETIIALTDSSFYYTKRGQDTVHEILLPHPLRVIRGVCLTADPSTVFVYGDNPHVIEINLKDLKPTAHNTNGDYSILSLDYGGGAWMAVARQNRTSEYLLLEGTTPETMTRVPGLNFSGASNPYQYGIDTTAKMSSDTSQMKK